MNKNVRLEEGAKTPFLVICLHVCVYMCNSNEILTKTS